MNAGTCRNQKCWTALSGNYIQIDHGRNAGDQT